MQEEGGNDCGGSRQEGMEEDERSCGARGRMKEGGREGGGELWVGGGEGRLLITTISIHT